ncbi:hypothetical protein [Streptomyces sp. SID3343]|uniref:hypothetical protein n=1 Tax=Streptomyces sp. SID3343 TaxID=2690260 RepID=UPI00136CB98A|nr:hypothetical protein [Streptomyces sp. SID3343]
MVPGVSAPTQRYIADFEREHSRPGAVADALAYWSKIVHGSRSHEPVHNPLAPDLTGCPCCDQGDEGRTLLEAALRRLPHRAARELRTALTPLDTVYLARVRPEPGLNHRLDWWNHIH